MKHVHIHQITTKSIQTLKQNKISLFINSILDKPETVNKKDGLFMFNIISSFNTENHNLFC